VLKKERKRKKEKRKHGRYVEKVKIKTKVMWQFINKEAGNFPAYDQKI